MVVVVDDGSIDRTAELAAAAGAEVLRLPFNCGIGTAVQLGLRFAAVTARGAGFLAEHYASDYPEVDAVVRLARRGFRLVEVPVVMRARGGGVSSIGPLGAVTYMVKVTVAILFGRFDTPAVPPDK